MSPSLEQIGQEELQYFGKVSASVTHELKNVLAILNENAGLLQDFAAMAEQGQPLDPERIRRLATTMMTQINRGDDIIKRMNRFAHSADEHLATVELNELVTMVLKMFERTATNRGVKTAVTSTTARVTIITDPFALETLLGSLLYRITESVPDIGTLSIEMVPVGDGGQINLSGLKEQDAAVSNTLDSDIVAALLANLQAETVFNPDYGNLVITLPGSIK